MFKLILLFLTCTISAFEVTTLSNNKITVNLNLTRLINTEFQTIVKTANLDPFPVLKNLSHTGLVNMRICNAEFKLEYMLKELTGLRGLKLTNFRVFGVTGVENGDVVYRLKGNVEDLDLRIGISGNVSGKCGFKTPTVKLIGTAEGKKCNGELTADITLKTVQNQPNFMISNIKVIDITIGFKDIFIDLNQLFAFVLEPIANYIVDKMTENIKESLTKFMNQRVAGLLEVAVNNKFPITLFL